jgi:glycosyltransferase involved in cell wall biosynthesis
MSETPNTDIIIPFRSTPQFRTEQHLDECIGSLQRNTHNYRLIFVDDNSDEIGRAHLHKYAATFPECVVIRTYKQRWFTRAVNLGFRLARTPWVVEVNSDVSLGVGWLEELYAVKDEVESKGAKVGLIGSVYNAGEPRRYNVTHHPDYVTGHTWLCSVPALEQVGAMHNTPKDYLSELSPLTIHIRSDNQLCYDLNQLGWTTVQSFKSGVGHAAGRSWGHRLHDIPNTLESVEWKYEH